MLIPLWTDHVHMSPDEYGICKRNLALGLKPPQTGSWDNWFAHGMGAAIRTELWACLAAGDPDLAADYAYEDACLDHAGEGIEAARFFAALEAFAFVEKDRETLLDAALARLPEGSAVGEAVADTRRWWAEHGDVDRVRRLVLDRWGHENCTDVVQNVAFTILGWLAGEGDFGRSICIAVNCGQDTDCTGATLGALLGILDPDGIPEQWLEPIGRDLVLSPSIELPGHPPTLDAFTDLVFDLRRRIGGSPPAPAEPAPEPRISVPAEIGFLPVTRSRNQATQPEWGAPAPLPRLGEMHAVELPGSVASLAADRFEGGTLVVRYRFELKEETAAKVLFNTPESVRVFVDGKLAFEREAGRMCPNMHRAPPNQMVRRRFAPRDARGGGAHRPAARAPRHRLGLRARRGHRRERVRPLADADLQGGPSGLSRPTLLPRFATSPALPPMPDAQPPAPRPVHYVFSSHWDREWYQPLQVFRYELVELFDRVLDAIASGELVGPFWTDGQCIQLEDYLQVRPERREELAAALRSGNIVSGPWYTLADELLVSGESLLRNLRLGRERVRGFGAEPSDVGFLCDLFGHNSQMPAILASFGIPAAYFWRGLNHHHTRQLRWTGADGTTLPCHRFGTNGYWGYAVNIGQFTDHENAAPREDDDGQPSFHRRLRAHLKAEAAKTPIDAVLLFDGPDHNKLDAATYALLKENLGEMEVDGERFELKHVSLDEHQRAVVAQADRISEEVTGELRAFGTEPLSVDQQWLTGGTSASRVWIKQANCRCQALLCHWAEPWGVFAEAARGRPEAPGFLGLAWAMLMQNHPHDSICGCSTDAVHRDMADRFRQVEQLARKSTDESLSRIAGGIDAELDPAEERLCVFHPLPRERLGVAELELSVPSDWPTAENFGVDEEEKVRLLLLDEGGERVPFQLLGQRRDAKRLVRLPARNPFQERVHRVRIAARLDLPAMGWRTLRLAPVPAGQPTPGRVIGRGIATGTASLDNGRLRVSVAADGTLELLDHGGGATYRGLLGLEDSGDVGDGWHFEAPANNRVVGSAGAEVSVAVVEDGPLQATLEVTTTLRVPAAHDRHAQRRSADTVELPVTHRVTLRAGERRLHVACTVDNTAEDHRLRVLFPTDAAVDRYLVDSPFDAVERPVGLPAEASAWRENAYEMSPQQSWTAAWDGSRGLAVVAAGLMETCVRDLPDRPVALTLFRATRRTPFTEGEPDGQLPGPMRFDFTIEPLAAAPDAVALTEAGQALNAGPQTVQHRGSRSGFWHRPAGLASSGSAALLDGPVVLSSLRRVADGVEARLFNPGAEPAAFSLKMSPPAAAAPATAQRVDSESTPLAEPFALEAGTLNATLGPKAFATFRFAGAAPT